MLGKVYDQLRVLTPRKARRWFKRQSWFTPITKAVFGTAVYSDSYYRDIERLECTSVPIIAEWMAKNLRPESVIDVGCGPGHMMEAMRSLGMNVFGIDLADSALAICQRKNLNVSRFDLCGREALPGIPYDLAVCCEVAEHLEEEHASGLVEKLAEAAPIVYLTAAETGAGGIHHHNEQPNEYWVELMHRIGMCLDEAATASARDCFVSNKVIGYLAKPMIYRRSAALKMSGAEIGQKP